MRTGDRVIRTVVGGHGCGHHSGPRHCVAVAVAALALALALASGAVAEESGEPAEPGDIKFTRQAAGMDDVPPATFPHWIHRIQYKCGACHEEPFKMKSGAAEITMDGIKAHQACGACHDGKAAFEATFDTCPRCHVK